MGRVGCTGAPLLLEASCVALCAFYGVSLLCPLCFVSYGHDPFTSGARLYPLPAAAGVPYSPPGWWQYLSLGMGALPEVSPCQDVRGHVL